MFGSLLRRQVVSESQRTFRLLPRTTKRSVIKHHWDENPVPNFTHRAFKKIPQVLIKPKAPKFTYYGMISPVSCVTLAVLGGSIQETEENNGVNYFIPYIGFSVH